MQPVLYSVREALEGRPHWVRTGTDICYYRNHFCPAGGRRRSSLYTLTFSISFRHHEDVCYLAYHYPYTYSALKVPGPRGTGPQRYRAPEVPGPRGTGPLEVPGPRGTWPQRYRAPEVPGPRGTGPLERYRALEVLALEIPGPRGPCVLSLSPCPKTSHVSSACSCVLSLSPSRCDLSGEDLNRQWRAPAPGRCPSVYHAKGLLYYLRSIGRTPLVRGSWLARSPACGPAPFERGGVFISGCGASSGVCVRRGLWSICVKEAWPVEHLCEGGVACGASVFCDYHGHSRKKNVFLYGCSVKETLWQSAVSTEGVKEDPGYRTIPKTLDRLAPAFSFNSCNYLVEKSRCSTARVVVWREMGVLRSYTLESTHNGCDQGVYKGLQTGTRELQEMGLKFCHSLLSVTKDVKTLYSQRLISHRGLDYRGLDHRGLDYRDLDHKGLDYRDLDHKGLDHTSHQ
ncbi:Cytosolic carboxypeptidase 1 [Liparis tanakae]|uniref:Cytosolic carboxypeptidase 1 n=1 Tax=Liparis tanakae TaxID=230148 RepID=A0A4Z2EL65_9TELE|nr:Cytosolic carboxypeptidase 1 [Liparis tanakae]